MRNGFESNELDVPNFKSFICWSPLGYLTEVVSENADALAMAFRERAPWCNFEPTLAFTVLDDQPDAIESLTIASSTGNTVGLEEVDLSSLINLRSLHVEERCFLFAKRFIAHGLQLLKSICIEQFCFVVDCGGMEDAFFSVKNCSLLESVSIGAGSFACCSSFELEGWRDGNE